MKQFFTILGSLFFLSVVLANGANALPITSSDGSPFAEATLDEEGNTQIVLVSETATIDDFTKDMATFALKGNAQEKPKIISRLLNNEVILLTIESDTVNAIGIQTDDDATITELRVGGFEKSTLTAYAKKAVFDNVQANPTVDTVRAAMKNKEIILKGVGFGNKLKLLFAKVGLTVASWFG